MGELGEDSEKEHQEIIHLINDLNFKDVILIGETFSKICKELNFNTFNNVESLIDHLRYNNLSGRKILVKGSHFIHLERLIDYL